MSAGRYLAVTMRRNGVTYYYSNRLSWVRDKNEARAWPARTAIELARAWRGRGFDASTVAIQHVFAPTTPDLSCAGVEPTPLRSVG